MSLAIECTDLVKTYPGKPPVQAVRGIDLTVHEGECFGVLGPNGAGKTTAIEILEGLATPTSGDVRILGRSWDREGETIRENIGISLQETQLSEKLTVFETLTLFRSFYRSGLSADEAIASVSLQEKRDSRLKALSGGQRQRVAVATALVGDPKLLFLDEPTTGLDPQSRRELWAIITDFRAAGGTVLLTTHYMDEAERLCDRVAIFDQGRVLAVDTPRTLIAGLGAQHVIEFAIDAPDGHLPDAAYAADLPSVTAVSRDAQVTSLSVEQPHVAIPALLARLQADRLELTSLTTRHATLEDVFVRMAGRHLADETRYEEAGT